MTTTFQTEIYKIKEAAVAERDRRKDLWDITRNLSSHLRHG
jgi:hypothetical protein